MTGTSADELNLAAAHEAIAATVPDRDCIVWRRRRLSWREVTGRTRRFANLLAGHGLGCHGDPAAVPGWESVQDHIALYLTNGNEYLEAMLGAFKARLAPINVNYRYVADELAYVLADAGARAVVYHARYAPTLAEVLPSLDHVELLVQVPDESGHPLLAGAVEFEDALAGAPDALPAAAAGWSPDDLYILYTGGTTGMPKGTLWRQSDFLSSCLGIVGPVERLVEGAARGENRRVLPAPPLMHGAAHWNAVSAWLAGGTVVMQDRPERLDPADVLSTCARERVRSLLIVGDAFARPLADEVQRAAAAGRPYDLSRLRFLFTGGAVMSPASKAQWVELVPGLEIVDILGSSESGRQGVGRGTGPARFEPEDRAVVLADDRRRVLGPGDDQIGWLATRGLVPRGYLGDPVKTEATFPVLDGVRYAVAGDRARVAPDGSIELHGRESVTINTGGEKVFAEEVEQALKHHPSVYDAIVVGRPDPRWGQQVVAVVQLRAGTEARDGLDDEICRAAATHIARYKLPRAFVYVDAVERSPSGKPDYAWARQVAVRAGEQPVT